MNILNTLIIGNYDDLRGDSAIYLLERAPSGSTNIYFSGTTGSLTSASIFSSTPVITHPEGDFTASINPLNWDDTPANLIYSGSQNGFDLIIYHQQDYGDWQNQDIINATLSASNVGIPVFTQHYNDTNASYSKTASFYGFPPTINVGWGNYTSGNSGSYGNELEFYDTINDGQILTSSILLYGDNTGLIQTENTIYIDNNDVNINELNSVASITSKYIKLVNVLSSSYISGSGMDGTNIYYNYYQYLLHPSITQFRQKFNYDLRGYFQQVSSNSASTWTPEQSFGIVQIQNAVGSDALMPDITSSIDTTNIIAGTPLYINMTTSSLNNTYNFTWKNFLQSGWKSTTITINNRIVFSTTDSSVESFAWLPDVTATNLSVKFYTDLISGMQSVPESNSIITISSTKNLYNEFLKLNYGYSCANNGKYIAIGTVSIDKQNNLNGIVDLMMYDYTTNTYLNKFLIKKLINPEDYNLILSTETNTIADDDSPANDYNISTELSSSYDIISPIFLGTEIINQEIVTENNASFYISNQLVPFDDNPLDLQLETINDSVDSFTDKFGTSLALNGELLAVGCPYFNITFINGDNTTGGSVDIYDLSTRVSGIPYYPKFSISSDDNDTTFGESVSFCNYSGSLYLAVGSSTAFDGFGAVFIYKSQNYNLDWILIQTIYGPSNNSFFGGKVKFDGSGLGTLVIGNSNTQNSQENVYIYEKDGQNDAWIKSFELSPDTSIPQVLEYLDNIPPVIDLQNPCGGFGNSIGIYGDYLIIGAPTDTLYSEYVGGELKHRGAVYFYKRCEANNKQWNLEQKTWGNNETLVNNRFGFDIDMYGNLATVTVPKYNYNFTADYINNTLNKRYDCNPNDSYFDTLGQVAIYEFSNDWNIKYTQQKVKDYGYPYLYYGFCNALYNGTFVVGAPCTITDFQNLSIPFNNNIQGYSYIYNINDLVSNYPVGNVFYRDGKIVLSNSGSIFANLMKDKLDPRYPRYDLTYKGNLTLHERQVVCTINPNEFNYSANPTSMINNLYFGFKDLDLMMKYVNNQVNGNLYWWNYVSFNVVEQSLFNMYTETYDIENTTISQYSSYLSSSYLSWDVDGNDKINLNDMTLIWKYFTNTLTQDDVFKHIEFKSTRKTVSSVKDYIQKNVIVRQYGKINPLFFDYDYSSSIDKTGSYLAPYITTIGLYNGADMVGVAKLATPIKNSGDFPLNILVKWDF
jgi:hypothetical protein